MENLNVAISFEITEKLSKITVYIESQTKSQSVSQSFDLLPGYPLDNYVKFTLTQFNIKYGTQTQNSPQTENNN